MWLLTRIDILLRKMKAVANRKYPKLQRLLLKIYISFGKSN